MHNLTLLIPRERIQAIVAQLAQEIRRDYSGRMPLLVGALSGAFLFLADLARALDIQVEIAFIQVGSYGSGTSSSGHVRLIHDLHVEVAGRDVLLVEDIVDSGYTAAFLRDHVAVRQPASLRLCTLLDKPSRRRVPVKIDYCGLTIPDVFVVGYGMDWNAQYRALPDICLLQTAAMPPSTGRETVADVSPTTLVPPPAHLR